MHRLLNSSGGRLGGITHRVTRVTALPGTKQEDGNYRSNPQGALVDTCGKPRTTVAGAKPARMLKMTCEILSDVAGVSRIELIEREKTMSTLHNQHTWFAVYTRSHHEKSVVQHLNDRGIENFLPLYKAVHRWTNHRKVFLDLPLFPNYLFVRIGSQERVRTLEVPGVVSLVGQGAAPAPLPELEIESLRSAVLSRKLEPHPYLTAGTKARIIAGPLAGMQGVVLRTKSGGLRAILTIDMIMQSVAVEVAAEELEPDGSFAPVC